MDVQPQPKDKHIFNVGSFKLTLTTKPHGMGSSNPLLFMHTPDEMRCREEDYLGEIITTYLKSLGAKQHCGVWLSSINGVFWDAPLHGMEREKQEELMLKIVSEVLHNLEREYPTYDSLIAAIERKEKDAQMLATSKGEESDRQFSDQWKFVRALRAENKSNILGR